MLLTALFYFVNFVVNLIFSIVPEIPNLPSSLLQSIYSYLDLIIGNGFRLLGLFVHVQTVLTLLPIVVVIVNFESIVKLIMFILKKIPIFDIS